MHFDGGKIIINEQILKKSDHSKIQKKIGYVPQEVILIDDTIKNNIVLGLNNKKLNYINFKNSLVKSNILNFVKNMSKAENYKVGESGNKISIGQKQRIGIARIIYRNSEILLFDEITSALDKKTEIKILKNLIKIKKNKIIIFISHKASNMRICDKIYKLENYRLKKINKI